MFLHLVLFICTNAELIMRYRINFPLEWCTGSFTLKQSNMTIGESSDTIICIFIHALLLLLLLLVFSPWAGLGRDQSSVRRLVWLWYTASWASS